MLNQRLIEIPDIARIIAIERTMKGERLELFQEAFDVLHEKDSPENIWRKDNLLYLLRGFERVNRDSKDMRSRPAGMLRAKLNGDDLGLISVNVVTTAGVNYVIDAFQGVGGADVTLLKYHASGTGTNAEAVGDTALQTETGSRVAGTQVEGASGNIYKTVATISYGSSLSITEHGLFSASTGGTLFDRSVFTAISVSTSISIEFTYEWTLNAGG